MVVAGFLYFACIAWHVPLTSWLTSAGIVGIAVGFAAKDTLANLFAGIFIVADAPYEIGDFVVLDNRIRGVVVDIGAGAAHAVALRRAWISRFSTSRTPAALSVSARAA